MNEFKKLLALALEELDIAKLLLERVHYRTSISRSYYSMYYATQALFLSQNIDVSTHKGLIRLFSLHFVKTGQFSSEWSNTLKAAYDLRQLSDYDIEFTGTLAEAEMLLEKATAFIKEVEQILREK
ncbi:HEPN domain-containing protein [Pseudanabaena yagii]|uniref:HEPN domain-containing protein n=1 Tax=Pseudanabaena yagii TaxID=2661615 RepID=UPI001CECD18B|nr:HEPN domain-containing protein [Pseudanabaena yagii]